MTQTVFISQTDRFAKNHGAVHRSSGMFYYQYSPSHQTTITLMNHFKHKNGTDVALLASIRHLDGTLCGRESLGFGDGEVIVYCPRVDEFETFEGSVEIEAFSATDLKIPFTAIAAVYEAPQTASLVHAYGRVYSSHEVEEGRTVPVGREAGWTVRDSSWIKSFAVLHNGANTQEAQSVALSVRNADGETISCQISLPDLAPFATTKLCPADYISDIDAFLNGREGTANIGFQVNGAFTRLLVGNESKDGQQLHVTHSNFNYSDHISESLSADIQDAYMVVPSLDGQSKSVCVYPEFAPGDYSMSGGGVDTDFRTGDAVRSQVEAGDLKFRRSDGALPARIVTGLELHGQNQSLPSECSLGVFHAKRPDKRLSWGVCAAADRLDAHLVVTDLAVIKGGFPADGEAELRIYSAHRHDALSVVLMADQIQMLSDGCSFEALIPGLAGHLGGDLGYFTLYSDYGGLVCYTLLKSGQYAPSIEHSF